MGLYGWNGVIKFNEVKGKIIAEQYCEILEDDLVKRCETLEMKEGKHYFQQNNNPKHTSKKAKKWFKSGLSTMIFKSYLGKPNPLT